MSAERPTPTPGLRWRWLLPATLLLLAFHFSPAGPALDRAFLDTSSRHPLRPSPPPAGSALVLVDDSTLARLGQEPYGLRWPFPRAAFAALLAALDRAGAKVVLVDFTFLERSEAAEQDLLLAATAAAARGTVLGALPGRPPVFWDADYRQRHAAFFAAPRTGLVEFTPDADGIVRRYPAAGSLAAAAFPAGSSPGGLLRWHGGLERIRTAVPVVPATAFILAGLPIVDRLSQAAPELSPEAVAPALAREPELHGEIFDQVRGRVVFVGANAAGTFDVKPFPVGALEPGVLMHWTAWAGLAGAGFISAWPQGSALLLAALALAAVLGVAAYRPGLGAAAGTAGLLGLGLPVLAYSGLSSGWFLPPATPVAAVLLAFLGVAVESFWLEQRRKREIQAMFGAYVDPAVVTRLVRDPDAIRLGGEKREATVYFSDLAGFTDLSERLPPEQLLELVNAYLQETSECLLDHGAYIDKYIGDAVMAVFGVPQALPDHALAACRGALAAQAVLARLNARLQPVHGVRLAMRIGINTGAMLVGNLGSRRKRNYTVLGDAVNLAARLEGANKEFGTSILLGEATARLVAGRMATRPLTRLRVKGKQTAVEVHELVGPAGTRADFLAAYGSGYAHYCARRFAEAGAALDRALDLEPEDALTRSLRAQAASWARNPPGPDWEPTLTLHTK